MKLAHYQLEQIRTYINDQSIWYDDVREEILDHVATSVEAKMTNTDIRFVDACAEVFKELDIQSFQRQRLKYEHIATFRDVFQVMLSFFTGKRLLYLVTIISCTFFAYSLSTEWVENYWLLTIWGPVVLMFYFIAIPVHARRFRVLYQSYYMSRINAIYTPAFLLTSVFGWTEDWLLAHTNWALIFFTAYHLFVVSGLMVMHNTLKQVKANVAI